MEARNNGRGLEAAIGRFFETHGYEVALNAIAEGRSGGRHEIDVLAKKTDPLTTLRVAVECKSWSHPIEKDVVSKLHYVIGDLALNKGIVVSTAGCRIGADQAAKELGIDLWGPDELRHYLGAAAVAAIGAAPRTRDAAGWEFRTDVHQAWRSARTAARGSALLRRQEEMVSVNRAWVPTHLATLSVTQPTQKRGRRSVTATTLMNLYDALAGRFIASVSGPTSRIDLRTAPVVEPLVKPAKVASSILKAYERRASVTSAAAVDRHSRALAQLGIPLPCSGVTVVDVQLAYFPVWLALLRLRATERLVAVSGFAGEEMDALSESLTASIAHVRPLLMANG